MENEQINEPVARVRPTFLTVLCILTFIGSGWSILNNFSTYREADTAATMVATALDSASIQIDKEIADQPGADLAQKMMSGARELSDPVKIKKNALFGIMAAVITLAGGFLMFQQNKKGFWIYVLGTLVTIVAPFLVFGLSNFIGVLMGAFSGFIGIVFCAMYAANLKHMS
jgi:hypothetical protein